METSRASADQRAGRAGREAPGEVYRLFVEGEYQKMPAQTPAEIVRCEMAAVYLQLKALGVGNIAEFPLMDRPPKQTMVKAAQLLCRLGALERDNTLTDLGQKLAVMPITPLFGFFLLTAVQFECLAEALTLVAMLSTDTPVFARSEKAALELHHEDGDHLTLLAVYSQWSKHNDRRDFEKKYGLNHNVLERASAIRSQLKDLVRTAWGVENITSCGGPKHYTVVRRCLVKACFTQLARIDEVNARNYSTLIGRQEAKIHPSSVLARRRRLPAVVVYNELVTTSRNYLRTVTEVHPSWLNELCPQYFSL